MSFFIATDWMEKPVRELSNATKSMMSLGEMKPQPDFIKAGRG